MHRLGDTSPTLLTANREEFEVLVLVPKRSAKAATSNRTLSLPARRNLLATFAEFPSHRNGARVASLSPHLRDFTFQATFRRLFVYNILFADSEVDGKYFGID